MTFSIIIPTYNGLNYLKKLLPLLDEIDDERLDQVLVVDSTSKDGTTKYIQSFKDINLLLVSTEEFDHGGTRTLAAKHVSSEILLFLTQDALPKDVNFYRKQLDVFEDNRIGAVYGRQLPYPQTNVYGEHLRLFNYPDKSHTRFYEDKSKYGLKTAFLSNSFSCYRKEAMDKINWFETGLLLSEDLFAGAKLLKQGYTLAYVSESAVFHSHSYTLVEEFKRYFDTGAVHTMNKWFIKEFGNAESEGFKFVISEIKYVTNRKGKYHFFSVILRNIIRYLAYKLGRSYELLPSSIIPKISMHRRWWKKVRNR